MPRHSELVDNATRTTRQAACRVNLAAAHVRFTENWIGLPQVWTQQNHPRRNTVSQQAVCPTECLARACLSRPLGRVTSAKDRWPTTAYHDHGIVNDDGIHPRFADSLLNACFV